MGQPPQHGVVVEPPVRRTLISVGAGFVVSPSAPVCAASLSADTLWMCAWRAGSLASWQSTPPTQISGHGHAEQ